MPTENSRIYLSVVIPAYNEAERVGKTLNSVDAYLKKLPYSYEIIIVDDGSRDATTKVLRSYAASIPNLKLLRFPKNRGKGWAVREGMLYANGRYRLFMDADGSTDIAHWGVAKTALDDGADVVVGSRHIQGSMIKVRQAPHREVLGYVFRSLVRVIFRMPIYDTQNGFKAFGAEAAERIFRRQHVTGWAFDVEILSIARRLEYTVTEIPIAWIDDDRSRMTFGAMPKMLMDLARIRLEAVQPRPIYLAGEAPQLIRLS
jgi:dolichyl-phosphate beta-glucosyltransferase